jgi:hypothetical protein
LHKHIQYRAALLGIAIKNLVQGFGLTNQSVV